MSPNPEETADLVTFTEEILNGKPHFLWSEYFDVLMFWPDVLYKERCS